MSAEDPRIHAIVDYIRSKLPSLHEMTAFAPSRSDDMGPEVTIPAVYLHILASHCECLRHQAAIARMEPKVRAYDAWANAMLTGQMGGEA